MPDKTGRAAAFMVEGENADRKNGRVADKLMLALPRELDAERRAQLVRGFAEEVTQGRAPWLAAFHDKGKDAHNPHAHLVIRDRDPETGKRVAELSEKGSTDRLRALWETHANRALEVAGKPERIDRRTLEAQGIVREPTVHEGPKAQQMDQRGAQPESRMRRYRNRPGSHLPYRQVDYRALDDGRSRPEHNRQVRGRETPADYWEAIDADKREQELGQLRLIHHPPGLVDIGAGRGRVAPGAEFAGVKAGIDRRPPLSTKVVPFSLVGLASGPTGFKPVPDGVARVPGHHTGTEAFHTPHEPVPEAVKPAGKSGSDAVFHRESIGQAHPVEKGRAMDNDDAERKLRQTRLNEAKATDAEKSGIYDEAMKAAYRNPKKAEGKMRDYEVEHGKEARNKELSDSNSLKFGRRPGSILSPDGFKPGAAEKQKNSHLARRALPRIIDERDQASENYLGAQRSFDALTPKPTGGGGGSTSPESKSPSGGPTGASPKTPAPSDGGKTWPPQGFYDNNPFSTLPKKPTSPGQTGEQVGGEKEKPKGFSPQPSGGGGSGDGGGVAAKKPESFTDKIRATEPVSSPSRAGSFSDKLTDARSKPQEAKPRGRGRDEELER